MPLNFAAAYSHYHVTGLNPAGNASLTNLVFVAGRFCVTQSRRPARTDDNDNDNVSVSVIAIAIANESAITS